MNKPSGLSNDVPPKLAALGEQLCDDAAFLATRYPPALRACRSAAAEAALASAFTVMEGEDIASNDAAADGAKQVIEMVGRSDIRSQRGPAWRAVAGASAAAVFVGIAAWSGGAWREAVIRDRQEEQANGPIQPSSPLIAQDGNGGVGGTRDRSTTRASAAANVLEGLSGAEQEAVLDLLDSRLECEALFSI